jgi:CRISPR-associated endonuclease/helicase Cas3
VAGILHDIGKYSDKFQRRLEGLNIRVDHSTAGAIEASKLYQKAQAIILQYIIAWAF